MGLEGRLEPREEWLRPEYEQLSSLLEKFRVKALLERLRQEFWKAGAIQERHGVGRIPYYNFESRVIFVAHQLRFTYLGHDREFVPPFTPRNPGISGYYVPHLSYFSPNVMVGAANEHKDDNGHPEKFLFIRSHPEDNRPPSYFFQGSNGMGRSATHGIDERINLTNSWLENNPPYSDGEVLKKLEESLFSYTYIRYVGR